MREKTHDATAPGPAPFLGLVEGVIVLQHAGPARRDVARRLGRQRPASFENGSHSLTRWSPRPEPHPSHDAGSVAISRSMSDLFKEKAG